MKYSQILDQLQDPKRLKLCRSCGLYLNQSPALDDVKSGGAIWVGLSAVKFDDDSEMLPLSDQTRTGELISKIESSFKDSMPFYKTNLVKCLPLNLKTGKIRYPLRGEMEKCYPNLDYEIETLKPSVIFLLGKQVSDFVLLKYGIKTYDLSNEFEYVSYQFGEIRFVPVHHPSYILVYKRKFISNYISGISKHLANNKYLM